MELAIRIMVVLFVAIVVAGLVIMFAKRILVTPEFKPPEAPPEDYVEVAVITSPQIEALVRQCWTRHHTPERETFERKICYSVRSLDAAPNTLNVGVIDTMNLDEDPATDDVDVAAASGDSAIFILFNGRTGKVEVN